MTEVANVTSPPPAEAPSVGTLDVERAERWFLRHLPRRIRVVLLRWDRRWAGASLVVTALAIVVAGAALVGWVLDTVDENRGPARWDQSAAEWGSNHVTPGWEALLETYTNLGGTSLLVLLVLVVGVIAWRRDRTWAPLCYLAIMILGIVLGNNLLKMLVDRERPTVMRLTGHSGSSFPSGHSAAAAAALLALALVLARRARPRVRGIVAATAIALAVGVAATRVLLGVHWLTDVVAGLAMGWTWFLLVTIVFGGRLLRFGEPTERVVSSAPAVQPTDPALASDPLTPDP